MNWIDVKYLIKHHRMLAFPNVRNSGIQDNQWFYFMHIPKAGGTSLRYALYDIFDPVEVYPNLVDYYWRQKAAYMPRHIFSKAPDQYFKANKKLLIGHYGLFPLELRESPPTVFTILRHPVSRLISALNYHSKKGRRFYNMSNAEVLKASRNLEVSRIANALGYDLDYYEEEKVENLFSKIDVIGVLEHLQSSIALLNLRFNWDLNLKQHFNKSRVVRTFSNSEIELMHELCSLDISLYNYGKNRFLEDCHTYKVSVK